MGIEGHRCYLAVPGRNRLQRVSRGREEREGGARTLHTSDGTSSFDRPVRPAAVVACVRVRERAYGRGLYGARPVIRPSLRIDILGHIKEL